MQTQLSRDCGSRPEGRVAEHLLGPANSLMEVFARCGDSSDLSLYPIRAKGVMRTYLVVDRVSVQLTSTPKESLHPEESRNENEGNIFSALFL
jgi:hypothetical protein